MRTPSLRRRAVLWSVAVLALLLLVVGVGVDLALGTILRTEQRQRLESLAVLSTQLTGLDDQSLANRLSMPGVLATIRYSGTDDEVVGVPQPRPKGRRPGPPAAGPAAPAATPAVVTEVDGRLQVAQRLRSGTTLVLTADSGGIDQALARFRLIMAVASAAAIALALLLLPVVLGRALRPLAALTAAADETAHGGRGRRLAPRDPTTDLGRAASRFDAMLEELEGAEASAEEAADRLARFLSDASHELRTPLAGVSAAAERLIRDPLEPADRDLVTVQLVREARRAARLVDDLLLVSRLGELTVDRRPYGLDALLREAADRVGTARDPLQVTVHCPPGLVLQVDALRIGQVLANLLGNARAAGAGQVLVRVQAGAEEVAVRFSDDGPGIPAAAREAVFGRLVRLDPARAAAGGGAGLGLPIARGLAAAHGGALTCVANEPADLPGAVFVLRLPLPQHVPIEEAPFEGAPHGDATGGQPRTYAQRHAAAR